MTVHDAHLKFAGPGGLPGPDMAARAARHARPAILLMLGAAVLLAAASLAPLPAPLAATLLPLRQSGMLTLLLAACLLAAAATGATRLGAPRGAGRLLVNPAGLLLLAAAAGIAALSGLAWQAGSTPAPMPPASGLVLASLSVFLAFPLLIAERLIAAPSPSFAPSLVPTFPPNFGTPALRRCASLPIACLLLCAAACLAGAAGWAVLRPASSALAAYLFLAASELAARVALQALRSSRHAPAGIAPALNLLLLRPLDGRLMRPRAWSARLRDQFGLDFARSWALQYAARAAVPLLALLLALCVLLTGLVRVGTAERGIYQRLGRPVAVLRPGLHLLLPWPLGQLRRVEYGVVHSVPISFGEADASPDAALASVLASTAPATAEGPPPPSANRLWESAQPSDVTYLIASGAPPQTGATAPAQQRRGGFELISVSMRVLYRIGLDPASARRAAYQVNDPATLVRMAASQLLARHLAVRTLQQVLVEDRAGMAHSLGAGLQAMLNRLQTGIEILDIAVEAAHPPAGAAAAYRQVQAAEIAAHTEISVERGRAETTAGLAARDASDALDNATAAQAERIAAAQAQRTIMRADAAAYRAAPGAFLLERRLAALQSALGAGAADILDPRLSLTTPPTLDLRQSPAAHAAPPAPRQDQTP